MTKKALQDWLKDRRKTESSYLFPNNRYDDIPCSVAYIQNVFYGVAKKAGLEGKHIHPHAIRHSVAFNLKDVDNCDTMTKNKED